MRRLGCVGLIVTLVSAAVVLAAPRAAYAACHAFTVAAEPPRASEGTDVTVTVTRDAAVAPSSVDVSSVDETARAGEDYAPVQQTINFTDETEQTFTVAISDDSEAEPDETFLLRLSNGDGCEVRPDFEYGPDAIVTIEDDDAGAPTTAASAPASTQTPPPDPATSAGGTSELAATGGGSATSALAGVLVLLALMACGSLLVRHRSARRET